MSGGPGKDGIPAIDDPQFATGEIDFLDPGEPIFGVARNGVVKAYPQRILVHHEIVNDDLDGLPVSVTYCPLTGTVQGFERGETTFGVSGRLLNSNLVMYDRQTETWWPQILATSIPGPWNEEPPIRSLREFRVRWTTWGQWRTQHHDTRVLTTETGYAMNYGQDPYGSYDPRGGYYAEPNLLFPALHPDDRLDSKRVVVGARTSAGAVAFRKDALRDERLLAGELGGERVVGVYDERLDTAYVYRNPSARRFEPNGERVTGTDGSQYRPDEVPLPQILSFDAMWFAWAGYYPDTALYE